MKTISSIIVCLGLLTSVATFAQEVATVKGKRALLKGVPEGTNTGDRFVVRDSNGKATALVEIQKVKNDKAIAQILKGRPTSGQGLTPYRSRAGTAAGSGSSSKAWGLLVGYSMDSMTVKPPAGSSISLSGSSLDLSGFYKTPIDGAFAARITGGYETLEVAGASGCENNTECSAKIGYIGLQGLATYSYLKTSSADAWVGAGLSFLFAMQKDSNVIDTSKLTTNQTVNIALGLDYQISPTMFVPLQFDYAWYPDTSTSSANQMNFRFGIGFNF